VECYIIVVINKKVHEMKVEKLKENKTKLEEDIKQLIESFEVENGVFITNVDFSYSSFYAINDITKKMNTVCVDIEL